MSGQRFIARERFDFGNGAIGWRPGGPFEFVDCGNFCGGRAGSVRGKFANFFPSDFSPGQAESGDR